MYAFFTFTGQTPSVGRRNGFEINKTYRIMKEKENGKKGCGCGCDFKKEVEGLVKDGKKPTVEERLEKKREVEAAFGRKEEEHK